jgi:RNA polymerase sigma-70 factor, ECF subfamily
LPPEEIAAAILRIKAGDTDLFWRLAEPYQQTLRITAYSLLRNSDDAAEVAQETMLKALRHLDQLKEGQCLKGWLIRITINEARMRMRKGREEPICDEHNLGGPETSAAGDCADWRDIPSNILERKEIRDAVHRALQSLSPLSREVFVLRDIQYLTVSETSSRLGISESKVSIRHHRARLQMRELLAPLFREPLSPWVPVKMVVGFPTIVVYRVVSREAVIGELSNYIEEELKTHVRVRIEAGLKSCSRCKLLLDPTNKLLYLVADEKAFLPPFVCNREGQQAFREANRPAFRAKQKHLPGLKDKQEIKPQKESLNPNWI